MALGSTLFSSSLLFTLATSIAVFCIDGVAAASSVADAASNQVSEPDCLAEASAYAWVGALAEKFNADVFADALEDLRGQLQDCLDGGAEAEEQAAPGVEQTDAGVLLRSITYHPKLTDRSVFEKGAFR